MLPCSREGHGLSRISGRPRSCMPIYCPSAAAGPGADFQGDVPPSRACLPLEVAWFGAASGLAATVETESPALAQAGRHDLHLHPGYSLTNALARLAAEREVSEQGKLAPALLRPAFGTEFISLLKPTRVPVSDYRAGHYGYARRNFEPCYFHRLVNPPAQPP